MPVERLSEKTWMPPWVHYEHLARYEWVASACKGLTVLDAACGTGYGSQILLQSGAARVDGFDLNPSAIDEAQRLYGTAGLNFRVGDVTNLPVADQQYDVFVCFETIEHLQNDSALLVEALRVLKPAGKFICSTPNRDVTNPGIPIFGKPYNRFHVREYTATDFMTLLGGFFPKITLYGQTWFGHSYLRVLAQIGRCWPTVAVRMHQLRKLSSLPWENLKKHWPRPHNKQGNSEVLIAICECGLLAD